MVSQECLDRCKGDLLNQRAKVEEEIIGLGEQANSVRPQDFEPQAQSGQFHQELREKEALYGTRFARLRRINVRISEIEKGTFVGVCPGCGKNIEEEALEENPLKILCLNCQRVENNRKK